MLVVDIDKHTVSQILVFSQLRWRHILRISYCFYREQAWAIEELMQGHREQAWATEERMQFTKWGSTDVVKGPSNICCKRRIGTLLSLRRSYLFHPHHKSCTHTSVNHNFTWEEWIARSGWHQYLGDRAWLACMRWRTRPNSDQPFQAWFRPGWIPANRVSITLPHVFCPCELTFPE